MQTFLRHLSPYLALFRSKCTIALLSRAVKEKKAEFCEIAEAEYIITFHSDDTVSVSQQGGKAEHEIYMALRHVGHPGVVLFSSGSTGKSKAAVHDFVPLLEKFKTARHAKRTIAFYLAYWRVEYDVLYLFERRLSCYR